MPIKHARSQDMQASKQGNMKELIKTKEKNRKQEMALEKKAQKSKRGRGYLPKDLKEKK